MIATAQIDDELEAPDCVLAELDAMREQLSAIEAALPDYGPSFSALEQQTQQITSAIDKIAASPSVKLSAAEHASKSAHAISEVLAPSLAKLQKAVEGTDATPNRVGPPDQHAPRPFDAPAVPLDVAGDRACCGLLALPAHRCDRSRRLEARCPRHRPSKCLGGRRFIDACPQPRGMGGNLKGFTGLGDQQ